MRVNLYINYWSLMSITLISSWFLFYVVASENTKLVTATKPSGDFSMSSDDHQALDTQPSSTIKTESAEQNTATYAAPAEVDQKTPNKNDLNENKNDKILPNYKKVKKLKSELYTATPTEDNIVPDVSLSSMSQMRENILSSSSVVLNVEISDKNDEIKKSSDSLVYNNDGNSNSEEQENLYNIVKTNEKTLNENNKYESSIKMPSGNKSPENVPTVEQHDDELSVGQGSANNNPVISNGLPDITDIPTVTVTELPLEILQQPQNTLDPVIIDDGGDNRSKEDAVNRTIEVIADTEEETQKKDEQIVKINDSGGGEGDGTDTTQPTIVTESSTAGDPEVTSSTDNIPIDTNNISTSSESSSINGSVEQEQQKHEQNTSSTASFGKQMNLTATEEVPMPVFSEWAQKQMEAAEKQQALEQEQTVNNSAQRKNNTNGNGKPTSLKIRAKNYASPDCGAKIIASSAYTSNAGAVLSSSKDEYMLSLCGNRIWFVVELCEAIQAQKIDLANFELYSSSPQNFTVAVSKRFPTREWSNVGRFEAEDKRALQSFDLHPHLFGKFVRVDINSHYSKEHFCTLSLFRVLGTSEFEAFETENHPNEDLDDFDDEYLLEQNTVKHAESNLFKSASDAVLSIVKKATEVLGKPANSQNQTFKIQPQSVVCRTPVYGLFSCPDCPSAVVDKVNNILTCEFSQLYSLLSNKEIRNDLLQTQVCAKVFGIETKQILPMQKDIRKSFYVNILPNEYVGALCQLMAKHKTISHNPNNSFVEESGQQNEPTDIPTNLTIDKKFGKEDLNLLDHPEKKLIKPEIATLPAVEQTKSSEKSSPGIAETVTEVNLDDGNQQLPRPSEAEEQLEATTIKPKIIQKPNLSDTNIYNVPVDELSSETEVPVAVTEIPTSSESIEQLETATTTAPPGAANTDPTPAANIDPIVGTPKNAEEDSNSWDNIEHLLTTVPSTIATGNTIVGSGQFNQQKNSNSPQSESVFIRLSNRIKALERNMSLSGQYLEELSRRYKKQVEELQQTLTQQVQTVRALEEENKRHHEKEQLYTLRNTQLKDEVDNITLQVHACIVVIIFVGAFVFLVLMVAILLYRSLRRQTTEVLSLYDKKKNDAIFNKTTATQKKINRRKSFEDFSDHQQSAKRRDQDALNVSGSFSDKYRRPSEEAMLILKESKTDSPVLSEQDKSEIEQSEGEVLANLNNATTMRQRKISVCYNSNQANNQCAAGAGLPPQHPQKIHSKRKGEKHSWPNSAHAQLQAMQHFEELNTDDLIGDSAQISLRAKKSTAFNSKYIKKKEGQNLRRQQSSPAENLNRIRSLADPDLDTEFDESIMLDEDDLDNFIPNTDLAYNEFMPDGPRGYQCVNPKPNAIAPAAKKATNKQLENNLKKSRRLSSPVFFKSPFTKSLKVGDLSKT